MYIEQGLKAKTRGMWKYFVLPTGFIILMIFNYISVKTSPIPVDELMNKLIEQFGRNPVFAINLVPLAFGLLVVLGWTKLVHGQSVTSLTTARKKIDFKRIGFSFAFWGLLTIFLFAIGFVLSPNDFVFNFKLGPFIALAIISLLLIPLQTSFEEYLFRGHMMQGIGLMAGNKLVPLIITSVLFGVMHMANPEVETLGYGIMVYYIGTGFFLGIITLMDDGLELALGFHAANNLIGALLVTADWTVFQTDSIYLDVSKPELGWDIFVPVLVIYPILILLFAKKYKWTNWKEKLTGKVFKEEELTAEQLTDEAF
ncbi:CPBP family intramembrane glutamic endopeptidase [Cellulophaga omnivescoria]|uniref:CPBP family intramembrane glutamic endopeptidase n=1 Tax=Cellulophaga omnivescoria TaxID=1888890 RepID=UPI0022F07546|nr:CPBP family intramembrane glutamic endopeptidase [Cellulophaga omnivescoria]WBU88873.1 CPBP family intramembrane metalloprotease [Cellulophaga omnivescoria]